MDSGLDVSCLNPSREEIQRRREWDARNPRFLRPNVVIRVLGWLLRRIVWESMRQHPVIDGDRMSGEPLATFGDAVRGRDRHFGYGP